MPLNDNDVYEPSEQLEMALKKWISKYLYSDKHGCTQEEYEEIFDLLCDMEDKFKQQYHVSNTDSNLTFEAKRNKKAEDMKQFALSKIVSELSKLKETRNQSTSNEEEEGWTKCEANIKEIVTKIWKIWCDERERRPRAGIILLYYGPSGSIEISLAMYYKNNSIQYGFAKGKFEFWEDSRNCAAREGAEEFGLDANYIYKLIQNLSPIKRNVFYVDLNTSIEHFYFVIPVRTKEIPFKLNRQEIHGVEWHNIFTLPCCINCQIKWLMQSVDSSKESNYFMVTCADRYKHNPLVLDILMHMDGINGSQTAEQYKTIHQYCCHN